MSKFKKAFKITIIAIGSLVALIIIAAAIYNATLTDAERAELDAKIAEREARKDSIEQQEQLRERRSDSLAQSKADSLALAEAREDSAGA